MASVTLSEDRIHPEKIIPENELFLICMRKINISNLCRRYLVSVEDRRDKLFIFIIIICDGDLFFGDEEGSIEEIIKDAVMFSDGFDMERPVLFHPVLPHFL